MAERAFFSFALFLIVFSILWINPAGAAYQNPEPVWHRNLPFDPNMSYFTEVRVPDGGDYLVASNRYDPAVSVYEKSGKLLWNMTFPDEEELWAPSIGISPDSERIAVAQLVPGCCHGTATNTSSNKVSLFDRYGTLLWEYPTGSPPLAVAVSGNGDLLIGTGSGEILCLNRTGTVQWQTGISGPVQSIGISGDGKTIAVAREEKFLSSTRLADTPDDSDLFFFDQNGSGFGNYHAGGISGLGISSNGEHIGITGGRRGDFYRLNRSLALLSETSFRGTGDTLSLSGDASLAAVGTREGSLFGVDSSGSILWQRPWSRGLSVSRDGTRVALGYGRNVTVLDRAGSVVRTYECPDEVTSVSLSGDGRSLAVTTAGGALLFDSIFGPGPAGPEPDEALATPGAIPGRTVAQPAAVSPGTGIAALGCVFGVIACLRKNRNCTGD